MARSTIRNRMGTAVLVMLLPTMAGVVLARSPSQPESKLAPSLTFAAGKLTTVPFEQPEGACSAPPWFRINFDRIRTVGAKPVFADSDPAPSPEEKVPGTVQNLHRAD